MWHFLFTQNLQQPAYQLLRTEFVQCFEEASVFVRCPVDFVPEFMETGTDGDMWTPANAYAGKAELAHGLAFPGGIRLQVTAHGQVVLRLR